MRFLLPLVLAAQIASPALACELLIKATDRSHPNPAKDLLCAKLGHIIEVREDGAWYSAGERWPYYCLIKLPGVPVWKAQKYVQEWRQNPDDELPYAKRLWRLRWADLPAAARNRIRANGSLTIRVGDYAGPADYDWSVVRQFLRNDRTNQDETGEL